MMFSGYILSWQNNPQNLSKINFHKIFKGRVNLWTKTFRGYSLSVFLGGTLSTIFPHDHRGNSNAGTIVTNRTKYGGGGNVGNKKGGKVGNLTFL